MAFIEWSDKLSINVADVDNQHKKLIAMINELFDAMKTGKTNDVIRPILEGMVSYAKDHFAYEERFFSQYGYPSTAEHVAEHKKFIDQLNQFIRDFKEGKLTLSLDLLNFLKSWLSGHILGTDKKYVSFFHEKGLK